MEAPPSGATIKANRVMTSGTDEAKNAERLSAEGGLAERPPKKRGRPPIDKLCIGCNEEANRQIGDREWDAACNICFQTWGRYIKGAKTKCTKSEGCDASAGQHGELCNITRVKNIEDYLRSVQGSSSAENALVTLCGNMQIVGGIDIVKEFNSLLELQDGICFSARNIETEEATVKAISEDQFNQIEQQLLPEIVMRIKNRISKMVPEMVEAEMEPLAAEFASFYSACLKAHLNIGRGNDVLDRGAICPLPFFYLDNQSLGHLFENRNSWVKPILMHIGKPILSQIRSIMKDLRDLEFNDLDLALLNAMFLFDYVIHYAEITEQSEMKNNVQKQKNEFCDQIPESCYRKITQFTGKITWIIKDYMYFNKVSRFFAHIYNGTSEMVCYMYNTVESLLGGFARFFVG